MKILRLIVHIILQMVFIPILLLIPVASSNKTSKITELKGIEVKYWNLKTGSKIAYYKLSAKPGVIKKNSANHIFTWRSRCICQRD